MQKTMTLISGTVLAIFACAAPSAHACSFRGVSGLKPAVNLPPGLTGSSPHPVRSNGGSASIVGLWHLTVYSGGVLVDNAFDAWHSDGTEVLNDFTDPIEDNVCLGVWTQTGPSTYRLKHPSWTFDTTGTLTGLAVILESVTVSEDGNTFTGPYIVHLFDIMGNPLGSYEGTAQAERIAAD